MTTQLATSATDAGSGRPAGEGATRAPSAGWPTARRRLENWRIRGELAILLAEEDVALTNAKEERAEEIVLTDQRLNEDAANAERGDHVPHFGHQGIDERVLDEAGVEPDGGSEDGEDEERLAVFREFVNSLDVDLESGKGPPAEES